MKFNGIAVRFLFLFCFFAMLFSCSKDDSKKEFGYSKIYMPQAILKSGGTNNNYPVPSGTDSSTYNYQVDETNNKVNIILGAALTGPGKEAFAVDITVDNDTVMQLLNTGTLDPALYELMPVSMYTIPERLEVSQGSASATFFVSLDIAQLKLDIYAGKYLVLAVKIANPDKYELNTQLSTTIIILDVNTLVIGPAINITSEYIKNPGGPFLAAGFMSGSTRWGTLKEWKTNTSALSHGGFGGFSSDNGGTMNMESGWGSPQILNGKIYQTISLPAGTYAFDLSGGNWAGGELFSKDPGYIVVAPGRDTLPDYNDIAGNTSVFHQLFAKPVQPLVNFELSAQTTVTLGVVVNYAQTEQGFKTKMVKLFNYPKHL